MTTTLTPAPRGQVADFTEHFAGKWQPGTEGLFLGLPESDYHRAPGLSHSTLKQMAPTLAHGKAFLDQKAAGEEEDSIDLVIGSLVHHAILTPDVPLPKIVLRPDTYPAPATHEKVRKGVIKAGDPLPWNSGAAVCAAWEEEQAECGLLVLKREDWDITVGCVKSLSEHPFVRKVLAKGESEVSGFLRFRNHSGEVLKKWRMDHVPRGNALFDIKTVARAGDASEEGFAKLMYNRGYHTQAAWYLDQWNDCECEPWLPPWWEHKDTFLFAVVEKVPPYAVAIYEVHPNALDNGRATNWHRLAGFMEAQRTEIWPGYPTEPQLIKLPRYALMKGNDL